MSRKQSSVYPSALGCAVLSWGLMVGPSPCSAQPYRDNETLYKNQDPNTETRRSEHIRLAFGHYNRDTGAPMTEQLAQGNLQMYEQMWHRWVVELGLHDINESVTAPDGHKYRANFNFLMTWNDGGGGGAYSSMDGGGFFYAMANSGYCRFDPPSGATPHEFGHVWEGSCGGFNGTDSSGAWWECTANWLQLQFLNSYPQPGAYIANGMYYPAHGRDYYDTYMIWEAAREDARYGAVWVNNVWTNFNADQQAHEYIIDRMIRCDTAGSADKAGASKDLWGDMARKLVTFDYERKQWLSAANGADDGSDWNFYQRGRTPLVKLPGANGWFRPERSHLPMEYGFNIIPLAASAGTTVSCHFQPQCDPVRQSDWRACLVAVNAAGDASYSALWNVGSNSITLSADQAKLYLVVIATPKPMKIADPAWQAYLTDAGLQFPYAVAFGNATPKHVIYPVQSHAGMTQHANGLGWKASTATVDATAYVGPNAQVLNTAKVRGYARIEDYAVVKDSAQVRDNAVVSGHALVEANAQVYGNAKVRDWGHVFGYAEIYENAKVIEHANCGDGNATTHTKVYGNAVVKGTTYVYDTSTFAGCLMMEGDSANGNGTTPVDHGVHFGWGWGQDTARYAALPDNGYLYAQHSFEKDNPVFAMDQYGINHGFLRNGCRATVEPTRGGRVLALDGASQYVELHNSLNDFRETALCLWVKWTGSDSDQRIWSLGDGTNKAMYLTPQDGDTGNLRFVIADGLTTQALDGGAPVPANTWTHVAVTCGTPVFNTTTRTWSATGTLYVNGAPVATLAGMVVPDSLNAPLRENANYLGRGNAGNYFQGYLDDLRVYMKTLNDGEVAAVYAAAAPAPVTPLADTPPPAPTWLVAPNARSDSALTMSATRTNSALGWSEYYFACTAGGGHDSGWVSFNKYTDVGLTPGTVYTYTVTMRDQAGHATSASAPASATTQTSSSGTASFAYGPVGIANGQITMTAATATNASGKAEYKFERPGKSSGWQSAPSWMETGLATGGSATYTVTVRDGRGNTSAPSPGAAALARDDAAPRLPIPVAHWAMLPYATISNSVSMTAQTASDPSGVRYYFHCVSGGGPDSGWQTSATFVTSALADGTYVYQYKVRDASAQTNESPYATSYPAQITRTSGYHTYTLGQVVTNLDDYLVSFPATVMKVFPTNYLVKDLATGATITVEPNTSNLVTVASLALKNVIVQGHLYTRSGARVVTWSTLTANGVPTVYTISGKVTNALGAGIAGASVYFSDAPNASSNAVVAVTTGANGAYTNGVTAGPWYVAAGASAYNNSADCLVTVSNASVAGVNFGLVSNAVVRGTITRRSAGTAVAGAAVYFSRTPGASGGAAFTASTAANGTYAQAVQDGVWYVAAGGTGFYTTPDKTVTVAGVGVANINFDLKSSTRNLPATDRLCFSAVTDSLPESGPIGSWAQYLPAGGPAYAAIGNPTVAKLGGVKWVQNYRVAANTGFRVAGPLTAIACRGVTLATVARPLYVNPGGEARGELIDLFYDRLALAISHADGRLMVARNGNWGTYGPALPQNQPTVLTLVVQTNGAFTVHTNGVQAMSGGASGDFSTSLVPTGSEGFKQFVDLGRNDPDGWSAYEGYLGDVFVYTNALSTVERQQLEADLTAKFLTTDYQVTASAGAGGTLNPSGTVFVGTGGTQGFSMTPAAGNVVSNVVVDGVSRGALSSYTFTNVVGNHAISATFRVLPTAPATLTIAPNGGSGLDITWPDTYTGQLLSSPSVGPGASWTPVGGTPAHVGGRYQVTVTPGLTNTFYGLGQSS
jgi:hypothetical protein